MKDQWNLRLHTTKYLSSKLVDESMEDSCLGVWLIEWCGAMAPKSLEMKIKRETISTMNETKP